MNNNKTSNLGMWIVLSVFAFLIIFTVWLLSSLIISYNNLVDTEENVNLAFANVQNVMQSRIEKIPDLVKVTDEAANHLETIYSDIAKSRASLNAASTPEKLDEANIELTKNINQFLAVVESYPTITASEQYTALMDSIEGASNRITIARELYNTEVNKYNRLIKRFPGLLIADFFGFEEKELFKADEEANNSSIVDFGS